MTQTASSLVTLLVSLVSKPKGADILSVEDLRAVAKAVAEKTGPVAYAVWCWNFLVALIPFNAGKFVVGSATEEEDKFFSPRGKANWQNAFATYVADNPAEEGKEDDRTLYTYVRDAFLAVGIDKPIPAVVAGLDFSQSPALTEAKGKDTSAEGKVDNRSLRNGYVNSWDLTAETLKAFGERIVAEYVKPNTTEFTKSPGRLLLALNINANSEGKAEGVEFAYDTSEHPSWCLDAKKVVLRCVNATGQDGEKYSFPAREAK